MESNELVTHVNLVGSERPNAVANDRCASIVKISTSLVDTQMGSEIEQESMPSSLGKAAPAS